MTNGAAWGVLILRVALGVIFIMHAYYGFAVIGVRGIAGIIVRLGFPPGVVMPAAWALIVVHTVGGALIIAGLWTRIAAVANIPIMMIALAFIHYEQGFFTRAVIVDAAAGKAQVIGYEFPLLVFACAIAVAAIGGGPFSIDHARHTPGRHRR